MTQQLVFAYKPSLAHTALVWLFCGMRFFMLGESLVVDEALSACATGVPPLHGVFPFMTHRT